jgi:hypothetical protein
MTHNVTPFPSAVGTPVDYLLALIAAAHGKKTELLKTAIGSC